MKKKLKLSKVLIVIKYKTKSNLKRMTISVEGSKRLLKTLYFKQICAKPTVLL